MAHSRAELQLRCPPCGYMQESSPRASQKCRDEASALSDQQNGEAGRSCRSTCCSSHLRQGCEAAEKQRRHDRFIRQTLAS
ncbi:hypothetical protein MHYP_G00294810 [Metynnis hypsauchen]